MAGGNHSGAWAAIVHFLTHAMVGMVIFVIVAIPAVALNWFIHWLENRQVDPYIIFVLTLLEKTIFTLDAFLYLVLMIKSMYKAGKELEL